MGDFIVVIIIGLLFGILGFLVGIDMADDHMVMRSSLSETIEECEIDLPRNEFCVLVAVPESEVE